MKAEQGAGHDDGFDWSRREISDREFALFQEFIHKHAGIWLATYKKALLVSRLAKRLRLLGLDSFGAYYDYVISEKDPGEVTRMIDCICTNETQFFREQQQFDFLHEVALPAFETLGEEGKRAKRLRLFSAACSTGEEPYSLAMMLAHYFDARPGWSFEITAGDLSTKVLEKARAGLWPLQKSSQIPEHYLKAYMLKGTGSMEGFMKVGPEIRSRVHFISMNLNEPAYPVEGPFDLIFCRNALIYFNKESKEQVIRRLLSLLDPEGLLFLGHSETLSGLEHQEVRTVIPSVYALQTAAIAPWAGPRVPRSRFSAGYVRAR